MATSVTLKDIQTAAQEEWGDFIIEDVDGVDVTLRHALRLTEKERDELRKSEEETEGIDGTEGEEEVDFTVLREKFSDLIRLVAASKDQADALLGVIGEDFTVLVTLVRQYQEATQLGEASDSEN